MISKSNNYLTLFVLLAATLLWSDGVVSTVSDALMVLPLVGNHYHVRASFVLHTHVHDVITLEEQLVSAQLLHHSFDETFQLLDGNNNNAMKMNFVNLQNIPPLVSPTLIHSDGFPSIIGSHWVIEYNTQVFCTQCRVTENKLWVQIQDGLSVSYHQIWEKTFCKELQTSSYEIFHDVDSCRIVVDNDSEYTPSPDVAVTDPGNPDTAANTPVDTAPAGNLDETIYGRRQIVFHARASLDLPSDLDLSDDELSFTDETLRTAYNEIHQNEDVALDHVTLQQHYTIPHDHGTATTKMMTTTTTSAMIRRSGAADGFTDYTYIWTWEVVAACHLCALQEENKIIINNNDDMLLPTDAATTKDGVSKKRGENEQPRWAFAFCDKLRKGPFEIFKLVRSCTIVVYL